MNNKALGLIRRNENGFLVETMSQQITQELNWYFLLQRLKYKFSDVGFSEES